MVGLKHSAPMAHARDSNDFKLRPFPNTLTAHSRDHSTWSLGMTSNGLKDILQSAVQLNKDHQYALNVYAERLEAELEAVDKLLVSLAGLERGCSHLNHLEHR